MKKIPEGGMRTLPTRGRVVWGGALFALALSFPVAVAGTFEQRFEAVYATEEAARRAVVSAADLPPGKAFSYSQRWDDSNPRHLKMADVLDPLGIRATFYICGYGRNFVPVMTNLVARGHSLGDHTSTHPFMQFLAPVAMFREIMENRVQVETDSASPVNAFSIPYGTHAMATDPETVLRFGAALANAGLLGCPNGRVEIAARLGLDPARLIGAQYFSINDRNPDANLFRRGLDALTNRTVMAKSVVGPHVTMGTHTWQTDEGFAKLSEILSTIARRNDIWFVNENEWIAFRVQRLAAKFRTVSVRANRVVYAVTRPDPADLGAAMPLYLSFSEPPVSVRLADADSTDVLKEGLPAGGHGLPTRYRRLGADALAVDGTFRNFTCTFANASGADWADGEATLRLPPGYEPGTVVRPVGSVRAGETKTLSFASEWKGRLPLEGDFYAAAQIDLHGPRGTERLWATCERKRPLPPANVPRDTCTVAGPYETAKDPGADFFAGLSRPGAPLVDFAGADGRWRAGVRVPGHHPSAATTARPDRSAPKGKGPCRLACAYELEADVAAHGEKWKLTLGIQSLPPEKVRLYLNGKAVPRTEPLTLGRGRNRLVVVQDFAHGYNVLHEIAVVSAKDGFPAAFLRAGARTDDVDGAVCGTTELKNGAEFSLDDVPEELTVRVKRGGSVRFLVEENVTTGYRWEATYARNECDVAVEHWGADASKGLCGAPGKAAFTVTKNAAVQSPSLVEFAYRRSWEKGEKPAKTVRLVLYTIPGEDVDFRYPPSRTLNMLKAECRNRGIELVDWHVHIRGGLTPEMAAEREKASDIRQSAMENHGREWEIFDNARLAAFAEKARKAKVAGHALPVGIQVNDRDWFRQIDAETRAKFDYVLADTMIMGKLPNGRDRRLWLVKDLAEIGDPERWMDEYVAMNLQILGEPISILANPGYLPAPLDALHDRLWTEERMRKVIGKAVARGIAIEIQAESPYPSPRFLRLAKAMGAKFSFGTNNYDAAPKDLSRWLEAIVWLDLRADDIWTPRCLKR